jgi:hypothetical protein
VHGVNTVQQPDKILKNCLIAVIAVLLSSTLNPTSADQVITVSNTRTNINIASNLTWVTASSIRVKNLVTYRYKQIGSLVRDCRGI